MGKNELAGVEIMQNLNIKVDVTQNDIVNIAVAELEAELTIESNKLKKDIKNLEKQSKEMKERIETRTDYIINSFMKKESNALLKAIKKIGINVKLSWRGAPRLVGKALIKSNKVMNVVVSISKLGDRYSSSIDGTEFSVKITPDVIAMNKDLVNIEDEITKLSDKRVEVNVELRSIPTMERQVRAKVSRSVLEKDAAGRQFLDKIKGVKSLTLNS